MLQWRLVLAVSCFASVLSASLSNALPVSSSAFQPSIINGREVKKSDYPEIVRLSSTESHCTGTIIGSHVVSTAAHCVPKDGAILTFEVGNTLYKAKFTINPDRGTYEYDTALGITTQEIKGVKPMMVMAHPEVGKDLEIAGYGCGKMEVPPDDKKDDEWNFWDWLFPSPKKKAEPKPTGYGPLRIGRARVTTMKGDRINFSSVGGGSVACYGDSGGPAFKRQDGVRWLVGIASRSDMEKECWYSSVDAKYNESFYERFAKDNDVDICGLTSDCEKKAPNPNPNQDGPADAEIPDQARG